MWSRVQACTNFAPRDSERHSASKASRAAKNVRSAGPLPRGHGRLACARKAADETPAATLPGRPNASDIRRHGCSVPPVHPTAQEASVNGLFRREAFAGFGPCSLTGGDAPLFGGRGRASRLRAGRRAATPRAPRRLRHGGRQRRADLRRQGPARSRSRLLSYFRPAAATRRPRRSSRDARRLVWEQAAERVRRPAARAGADPPLAAALQRRGPAAPPAARATSAWAGGPPPYAFVGGEAAADGDGVLRAAAGAAAGRARRAAAERLVPAARLPAEAGDGLRRPERAVPDDAHAGLPAPRDRQLPGPVRRGLHAAGVRLPRRGRPRLPRRQGPHAAGARWSAR